MEHREDPSMEDYRSSSDPYVTDDANPTILPMDGFVADGYFGSRPGAGGPPRPPVIVVNPYITNTTETTADMAVTDGYFNGRPHQQLPVVHLPDEDPVKTALPSEQPRTEHEGGETSARPSQEDDRQTVYSRVSFGSERSTLPPSYTSRPMSRRDSYESDRRRSGETEREQGAEVRPLIMGECLCRHPQCISCVANGTAFRDREERCSWRRRLRCARGCTRGARTKKGSRKFRFCCASIFFLVFTWTLFGGLVWKHAASRLRESLAYMESNHCSALLPGTYEESFTIPLNDTLSSFSLQQAVVYDKGRKDQSTRINVDGYVNVEHATAEDKLDDHDVLVKVEYQVTNESILGDINIGMTDEGVDIRTNGYTSEPTEDLRDVCVFFRVTVKFPKHASTTEIQQMLINTEQLAILLRPSLSLKVLDKALLNTITGNIWSKTKQHSKIQDDEKKNANFGLQAKRLLIGTTTGNIRGVWGLADYASLESKSGNIDIGVTSLTSLSSMSPHTDLSVTTVSGDVAIHSVSTDGTLHPFRKDLTHYNTVVKTISGDVIGQYLLGSSLSIQTISGNIEADILPISPTGAGCTRENQITLDTDTKSGKSRINFLEATDAKVLTEPKALLKMRAVQTVMSWIEDKKRKIWQLIQKHCADHDSKPQDIKAGQAEVSENATDVEPLYVDPEQTGLANLAFFKATHSTVSGEIFTHYSAVFEGSIKATTLTGDIEVGGENVRITRNEKNFPVGRVVEAVHGDSENGFIESKTISGDIKMCVGDARW